jgi:exosortase A
MIALLALFWPTAAAILHQWDTSSAYSYGYLIAPIALYLIWRERSRLALLTPQANFWCAGVTAVFALAWLLADALDIDEGRAFALIGMLQGLFLTMLGWRVYRFLAFPLLYLWLMVPTGEFLLPALQRLSHGGAVGLLSLSGVPVFTEGMLIEVPAGRFMVEPGCAGLNFLLTALALSLLYGKIFYRSPGRRLLCVGIALITALAANVVRIYLIIGLAEFTDRKIDISDDHLLYGWGFFALIMVGMMWLGAKFAEPHGPDTALQSTTWDFSVTRTMAAAAAVTAIAASAPLLAYSAHDSLAAIAGEITVHAPFLSHPVSAE